MQIALAIEEIMAEGPQNFTTSFQKHETLNDHEFFESRNDMVQRTQSEEVEGNEVRFKSDSWDRVPAVDDVTAKKMEKVTEQGDDSGSSNAFKEADLEWEHRKASNF